MAYKDKVVIITGGSKGIGKGCVEAFVAAGAKVVFCARHETEGQALAEKLTKQGPGEAQFKPCDVSRTDEIKGLIDEYYPCQMHSSSAVATAPGSVILDQSYLFTAF